MYELVVTQAFADYKVGDRITDAETIDRLLDSHAAYVVKVSVPPIH